MNNSFYAKYGKRLIDIAVSGVLIVGLSPIGLVVCALIKLTSSGPCFYRQQRVGLHEQPFGLLKFRTMTVSDTRNTSQTLPGDSGITPVGQVLRRTKIDESAQLLNVLLGHMSLVGPRPCLPNLLEKMDEQSRQRFSVRPGLSGLAQVNGNIYLDWPARWQFDCRYARELSLFMDIGILYKTVLVVILGEKALLTKKTPSSEDKSDPS